MITINEERFEEVFGTIFKAYRDRKGVFARHTAENFGPQQIHKPKKVLLGDANHLYWLALVGLSDRRTNSSVLYPRFAEMFDKNPSLFIRGRKPSLLRMTKLFRKYKIGLPVGDIVLFIKRKDHLDRFFNGNPLNIYEGVTTADELIRKLKHIAKENGIKILFPGAKEKMFSLLAMFLSEVTELEFADIVPIDVWVQAICTSTGVLVGDGRINNKALERKIRPLMTKLFQRFKNIPKASNATWILGKRSCSRTCIRQDLSATCPVYQMCQGPFTRTDSVIQLPLKFLPKGLN